MLSSIERIPTYADEKHYSLPNDDVERSRLDEQHRALFVLLHNRTIHAPLKNPDILLDVGCGTGAVTIDLSAQYPGATVYGIDLAPAPTASPPNAHFITGNIRDIAGKLPLTYGSMNFVFCRFLCCGMTDWQGYINTAEKLLRSGGWIEVQDMSYRFYNGYDVQDDECMKWVHAIRDVAAERNMDLDCGSNAAEYMRRAGLVEVEVVKYKCPLGIWMKTTNPESEWYGRLEVEQMSGAHYHLIDKMLSGHVKYGSQVKDLQINALQTLIETPGQYYVYYATIGRKP
ncbi:hypothetical protein MMC06_000915 [Schaereria dolodes]|nr:hypothetical protein [Schaereria dolodes]